MRRTSKLALGLITLAALAALAAGCGGSSKSSATTAATTEAAMTEATTTEAAMTHETTTEAATTEATTTKATTTTGLSGLAASGKCRDLLNLSQKFSSALTGAANGGNLKKQADLLQSFAKQVPSEIRDDFKVIADYFSKVADAVGNIKPGQTPDADTLAKLQKLSTEIDQAKLTQASQHLQAWGQKNCHA